MRLLLLAGSGEARAIAEKLSTMKGVEAIASLAGVTRKPDDLALPTRIGGFGGGQGFESYLSDAKVDAVLDATHPFAARITARTAQICGSKGLPHSILRRPEWKQGFLDRWHFIDQEEDVAGLIPRGMTVFLATGRQGLEKFANLRGRRVFCRRIDWSGNPFPFEGGEYIIGRPPFSIEDETCLFTRLAVDWLVVKNSGGTANGSKLEAAPETGHRRRAAAPSSCSGCHRPQHRFRKLWTGCRN